MKSVVKLQLRLKLAYHIQILGETSLSEAENKDHGNIKCSVTWYSNLVLNPITCANSSTMVTKDMLGKLSCHSPLYEFGFS